ncbi:MAG TPA: T9SS type A sorting domain-containing protein [Bacteroidia bacterium]|nr:T9SS type A sorting domain-containing protein [Bacteroidia bacterium]
MKIIFTLLIFLFFTFNGQSQFKNNIWCFGDSAGINFVNPNSPSTFITSVKSRGSCVSICDTNSNVLFYAYTRAGLAGNTTLVKDRNNNPMQNGTNVLGQGWYYELIIVPFPSDTNKYYLFSIGVSNSSPYGLYYSIIDMTLNNGLGAVTQKNIQVNNMKANDGLTAIQHGNGRDWWLLFRGVTTNLNNTYFKYLIDKNGVLLNDTQNIGSITNIGFIKYSFDKTGNKLVMVYYNGLCETFDFDRCTGQLSNNVSVRPPTPVPPPIPEFWSCDFSPNGRFLYIATSGYYNAAYLIQVDLLNPLLYATADTIDSITGLESPGGQLKRGPDDKIYWSCAWIDSLGTWNYPYPNTPASFNMYNMNLSVINSPDSLGAACNFTPYSFYLGGARTYWGLPNNPDYDLGPLKGSPCDTLTLLTPALSKGEGVMQITYVAAWEKLFVNASGLKGKNVTITIYDGRGSLMFEVQSLKAVNGYFTLDLDCSGWAGGVYVVHLETEREVLSKKFIIE